MSGSGWETIPAVLNWWEALPDVREWSGDSPKCPGFFGRPSRMTGSGRETLPDVRVRLGGPPECPGVVGSSSQKSGRPFRVSESFREALLDDREWSLGSPGGREVLPDVQEWLGSPPGCPGVVGRPSRMSGSGWLALPEVLKWSEGPP